MNHSAFQVAVAFIGAALLIMNVAPNRYTRAGLVLGLLWFAIPGVPPEPLFFVRWAVSTAAFVLGIAGLFAKWDRI